MNELAKELRRNADYLLDVHQKQHPNQCAYTPRYVENMRKAADEIERLTALVQNGQSAIDTNQRLAEELEKMKAKLESMSGPEPRYNPCEDCPHLC